MNIKKFEALTFQQALTRVKAELGPDALIISSEEKRRGWFKQPVIEITAAFEPEADKEWDDSTLEKVFPHRKKDTPQQSAPPAKRYKKATPPPVQKAPTPLLSTPKFEEALLGIGLSAGTAREFARQIVFDYPKRDRENPGFVEKLKAKLLSAGLKTLGPEVFETRRTWAAVGSPGAGKTSLMVKLALWMRSHSQSVVLNSIDRRKIVGRQELAAYAKLINVPFSAERSEKKNTTIALLDTPSLGVGQELLFKEVGKNCRDASTVVVLDASLRLSELLRTVDRMQVLAPVALAFTRLDLVSEAGVVYEVLKQTKLPLLGMSVSHSFSESFRFFESADLARYILRHPFGEARNREIINSALSATA